LAFPRTDPRVGDTAPTRATVHQRDVVRVSVASPRDGAVTVHGLSDLQPISADGHVTFEFRAIYSGRFPVHFHGMDGSHIEIAAFEVMPATVALLKVVQPAQCRIQRPDACFARVTATHLRRSAPPAPAGLRG